ncbi:hypothetical protein LINPERPRIM_LOCUS40725 [Linum perenne]
MLGMPAIKLYEIVGEDRENPPILIANLIGKEIKVQVQVNAYNIKTARTEFTITNIIVAPIAILSSASPEHVTTLGESPKSPKSCVSALHSATLQSSKQAENCKDKFKVAAIQFNEDDQDELSDDVPLATIRKRLKRRRYQISDDE